MLLRSICRAVTAIAVTPAPGPGRPSQAEAAGTATAEGPWLRVDALSGAARPLFKPQPAIRLRGLMLDFTTQNLLR